MTTIVISAVVSGIVGFLIGYFVGRGESHGNGYNDARDLYDIPKWTYVRTTKKTTERKD